MIVLFALGILSYDAANRYSYHTTLVALSKGQQFDKAFDVYAAMKDDGVLPDAAVYRYT